MGRGKNRRTLIFDRDVAQAALLAASHTAAAGQMYNVTDGRFHSVADIITSMCHALDRTPPRFHLPIRPMYHMAGLADDLLGIFNRQSPISQGSVEKYTADIAVDGRRIQDELGFSPHYDLATGWNETVEEMRRSGVL